LQIRNKNLTSPNDSPAEFFTRAFVSANYRGGITEREKTFLIILLTFSERIEAHSICSHQGKGRKYSPEVGDLTPDMTPAYKNIHTASS